MADKKLTVERGEKVRVEIPKEGTPTLSPASATPKPQPKSIPFTDYDEELYTFLKGITFYDLGTRKQVDGTYAHVAFESFTTAGNPTSQLLERYHAALLAGDFTKGSTCLKLPQASEYLWLDAVFTRLDGDDAGEQKTELIGNKDKRFYVSDIPTIAPPEPVPPNVTETKWRSGSLPFSEKGEWAFMVKAVWLYNSFRTDTAAFKVTETNDLTKVVAAPGVVLKVKSGELMRVYLTPRCNWYGVDAGGGLDLINMSRLLPVLPKFEPYLIQPFTKVEADIFQSKARAYATTALWNTINAYYASIYPEWITSTSFIDSDASAQNLAETGLPVLVAVLVKGGRTYYVWQMSTTAATTWKESRVYNPAS